jgi:hypothetical protein
MRISWRCHQRRRRVIREEPWLIDHLYELGLVPAGCLNGSSGRIPNPLLATWQWFSKQASKPIVLAICSGVGTQKVSPQLMLRVLLLATRRSNLPPQITSALPPKADVNGYGAGGPLLTQLRHSFSSQFALPPICTSPGWATTRLSGARLRRSGRWSEHECCRKVTLPVTARSCLLDGP